METFDPETTVPLTFSVNDTPWLRGWEPIMDWLVAQGVMPDLCCGFTLYDEGTSAIFELMELDGTGKPKIRYGAHGAEVVHRMVRRPIDSLPPYRTPSGRVLR